RGSRGCGRAGYRWVGRQDGARDGNGTRDFDASVREKHASFPGMHLLGEVDLFPIVRLAARVESVPIAGQTRQGRVWNRASVRPIAKVGVGKGLIILGGTS